MNPNVTSESVIRRLGIYRVLLASNVQYNSILFRIIVGVTGGLPVKSVALVSFLEFVLLTFLEVPTGILADRIGRVRVAVVGFILTAASLLCLFLALESSSNPDLATVFLIVDGILTGVGRPMFSGAVEAFYQDAISRFAAPGARDSELIRKSFTLSNGYGKYISTFAIAAAFLSIAFLRNTNAQYGLFLIGGAVYLGIAARIYLDYRTFGDSPRADKRTPFLTLATRFASHRRARFATVINLTSGMYGITVLGFIVIAVGRSLQSTNGAMFYVNMASFMFGSASFGWILKAHLLPYLVQRLSERNYLTTLYAALFVPSAALGLSWGFLPSESYPFVLCAYGIVFQIVYSGTKDLSTNMALEPFSPGDYATVTSLCNIPSYTWVWVYDLYLLWFTANGAPGVQEIFFTVAGISALGFGALAFFYANEGSVGELSVAK